MLLCNPVYIVNRFIISEPASLDVFVSVTMPWFRPSLYVRNHGRVVAAVLGHGV